MKNSKLNSREKQVLNAIVASADEYVGGDFTYIEWIMENISNEFSISQVKGYLSQLQKKYYINCCEGGQICTSLKFENNNFNFAK